LVFTITVTFVGATVSSAMLLPTLGLHLFWTQVSPHTSDIACNTCIRPNAEFCTFYAKS